MHSVAANRRPAPLPPSGRTWADAYEPEHHRRSLDRMIEDMESDPFAEPGLEDVALRLLHLAEDRRERRIDDAEAARRLMELDYQVNRPALSRAGILP